MSTSFEPFRITTVEPIRSSTRSERRAALQQAQFNVFRIPSEMVMIDLITDSGTGAMSRRQWSAIHGADESYSGSSSHRRLLDTVSHVFGFEHVLPTHQGRVSEQLLVEALIGSDGLGNESVVPANACFDSTRDAIHRSGASTVSLLEQGGDDFDHYAPFKGNIDVDRLRTLLKTRSQNVPFVLVTITCNSNGGQPVSLANLRAVREICTRFGKLLIFDAGRFAENAWFIQDREPKMSGRPLASIVREMFELADGVSMSTKKDALAATGGLLMLREEILFNSVCESCILTEGFEMACGGLPGRDMDAIAVGLEEVLDETFLPYRVQSIAQLAKRLGDGGVPVAQPPGGHCLLIDAEQFCPHIPHENHPAQALVCALYESAGIRASRIGSVFKRNDRPIDLVRLAIPRRTYTDAHLHYVADSIIELKKSAKIIEPIRAKPLASHPAAEPTLSSA